MMKFLTVDETNSMIESGDPLFIAGAGAALRQLKQGAWIGGSIPYFMTADGGLKASDRLLVRQIADTKGFRIEEYGVDDLSHIPADYYQNGCAFILIPGFSKVHSEYAEKAFSYPNLLSGNLIGWITGNDLDDPTAEKPHIVNGLTLEKIEDKAVVLHVELPAALSARIEIVNIFEQGEGDVIEFAETSFQASRCSVNGRDVDFADYVRSRGIDQRLPLVANYSGAKINVSFRKVEQGSVSFFAPVFPHVKYQLARPIQDYKRVFQEKLRDVSPDSKFACNCILNYLYANLEGQKCGPIAPMTFGEIAYILLNQTMVFLFVDEVK